MTDKRILSATSDPFDLAAELFSVGQNRRTAMQRQSSASSLTI